VAWALLLALLLGARSLSPPGFMPTFADRGLTISICPDADPVAPMPGSHQEGHSKALHQPCAYASATSFALGASDAPIVAPLLLVAVGAPIIPSYALGQSQRGHERPPLRGPPISD
jgi:hypothetical protein